MKINQIRSRKISEKKACITDDFARKYIRAQAEKTVGVTSLDEYLARLENVEKLPQYHFYSVYPLSQLDLYLSFLNVSVMDMFSDDVKEMLALRDDEVEVMNKIKRLSKENKIKLIELWDDIVLGYFKPRRDMKGTPNPLSVIDRYCLSLNNKLENISDVSAKGRKNSRLERMYLMLLQRRSNEVVDSVDSFQWRQFGISCGTTRVSPHWILMLSDKTPFYSEDGIDDLLYDYYSIISDDVRPYFIESVDRLNGDYREGGSSNV